MPSWGRKVLEREVGGGGGGGGVREEERFWLEGQAVSYCMFECPLCPAYPCVLGWGKSIGGGGYGWVSNWKRERGAGVVVGGGGGVGRER